MDLAWQMASDAVRPRRHAIRHLASSPGSLVSSLLATGLLAPGLLTTVLAWKPLVHVNFDLMIKAERVSQ